MAASDKWRAFWGGFSGNFNPAPSRRDETPEAKRQRRIDDITQQRPRRRRRRRKTA